MTKKGAQIGGEYMRNMAKMGRKLSKRHKAGAKITPVKPVQFK